MSAAEVGAEDPTEAVSAQEVGDDDVTLEAGAGGGAVSGRAAPAGATPDRLGRFRILDQLGAGGMGVVYAAYDPQLDRRVALKVLKPQQYESEKARERLLREAQALGQLSHPNVLPIHDVGIIDDCVFLVMEYVDGVDLKSWLAAETRSWRDILDVYIEAGYGLAAAHAVGLAHRDFKPENVIVGADGRVRVIDFGLARDAREPSAGEDGPPRAAASAALADAAALRSGSALTTVGMVMGTPAFMSPQQMAGEKVGPESDQFSFCVAVFHSLYQHLPYAGATIADSFQRARAEDLYKPEERCSVPRWIYALLAQGLRYRPEDRFPSMMALLERLGSYRSRDLSALGRSFGWVLLCLTLIAHTLQLLVQPGESDGESARMTIGANGVLLASMAPVSLSLVPLRRLVWMNPVSRQMCTEIGLLGLSLFGLRLFGVSQGFSVFQSVVLETSFIAVFTLMNSILLIRTLLWPALCYAVGVAVMFAYPGYSLQIFIGTNFVGLMLISVWWIMRPPQAIDAELTAGSALTPSRAVAAVKAGSGARRRG